MDTISLLYCWIQSLAEKVKILSSDQCHTKMSLIHIQTKKEKKNSGCPSLYRIYSKYSDAKRHFFLDTAHCVLSAVGLFGHSLDIMPQTACLLINPIIVNGYASLLIARRQFGPQTQWWPLHKTLTSGLGLEDMSLTWPTMVQLLVFIYSGTQ